MDNLAAKAVENLENIKKNKPLIHNITNYVVMNFTANVLLAMGASPVMAHAGNEVSEMAAIASALVLNIGTLSDPWIAAMMTAGRKATELGTPIVLDPVGSGATTLRTSTARAIIEQTRTSVIRGNASEILSLSDAGARTKGVDTLHSVDEAAETAKELARALNTTLAITGAVDLVTDGVRVVRVANGHPLMPVITGSGCAATAVVGAFLAVDKNPVTAAATALAFFGLAGEKAGARAAAPGSFQVALLDALYTITPEELGQKCRLSGD
ncbi:hydroxyethylthiazole kinase [bacterium]|nr:hydroxyethylthiazole kinase [bacterium]